MPSESGVYGHVTPKSFCLKSVILSKMFCQVAQNPDLGGSKFYHAQQYLSIPFTILLRLFCLIEDYRMRYITHLSHLFLVIQGLKSELRSEIYFTVILLVSFHYVYYGFKNDNYINTHSLFLKK